MANKKFRLEDAQNEGEGIADIISEFDFIGNKNNLGDFSHDVCVPHCNGYCKCTNECKCESFCGCTGYNYCSCQEDCEAYVDQSRKGAGGGHP